MKFLDSRSGATAIEYALLAGGIALVIITAVNTIGTAVNGMFNQVLTGF